MAKCLQGQGEYALIMNEDEALYLCAIHLVTRTRAEFSRGIGNALLTALEPEFVKAFIAENSRDLSGVWVTTVDNAMRDVQKVIDERKKQKPAKPPVKRRQRRKN